MLACSIRITYHTAYIPVWIPVTEPVISLEPKEPGALCLGRQTLFPALASQSIKLKGQSYRAHGKSASDIVALGRARRCRCVYLRLGAFRLLFLLPLHALCRQIEPLLVAILVQDQVLGCTASIDNVTVVQIASSKQPQHVACHNKGTTSVGDAAACPQTLCTVLQKTKGATPVMRCLTRASATCSGMDTSSQQLSLTDLTLSDLMATSQRYHLGSGVSACSHVQAVQRRHSLPRGIRQPGREQQDDAWGVFSLVSASYSCTLPK